VELGRAGVVDGPVSVLLELPSDGVSPGGIEPAVAAVKSLENGACTGAGVAASYPTVTR
jgi:hypothetical protein